MLAAALAACQAPQRSTAGDRVGSAPVGGPRAPETAVAVAATPAASPIVAIPTAPPPPDPGPDAGDPSSTPSGVAAAGSQASERGDVDRAASCEALPHAAGSCGDEDPRAEICRSVVAEFRSGVARDAVACLAALDSSCDYCGVRQCAKGALERAWDRRPAGHRGPTERCEPVRRGAQQVLGDGAEYAELCARYAYGMNARGKLRFIGCLTESVGIGVRYCLWDPTTTPCTEGHGRRRRPGGF